MIKYDSYEFFEIALKHYQNGSVSTQTSSAQIYLDVNRPYYNPYNTLARY